MLQAINPPITSALVELSVPINSNWFIQKGKVANGGHIVRCDAVCIGNALQGGMLPVTFPLGSI
jgi:hypothetical protein